MSSLGPSTHDQEPDRASGQTLKKFVSPYMILKNCEGVGNIEKICMILKPKFTYKYLNKFFQG